MALRHYGRAQPPPMFSSQRGVRYSRIDCATATKCLASWEILGIICATPLQQPVREDTSAALTTGSIMLLLLICNPQAHSVEQHRIIT